MTSKSLKNQGYGIFGIRIKFDKNKNNELIKFDMRY